MESRKFRLTALNVNAWGLIFYSIATLSLLSMIMLNQRDYNDPWILDGILIPTLIFVFIFFTVQTFVRSNKKIAVVTAFFLAVLNLIPGFKYQLFYNTYDSTFHFRFTSELSQIGNVEGLRAFGTPGPTEYYIGNPGWHILMSSFSVVTGIPINEIFRFVVPATFGLAPIIVFFLTKNVLSEEAQKYAIVASAFPIAYGYIVTGTGLSMVIYFLLFAVFLRFCLTNEYKREHAIIFIILGFTLIISHPVTPISAALLLIGLPIGLRILHVFWPTRFLKLSFSQYSLLILLYSVMLMTWWAHIATADLVFFSNYIKKALSFKFMTTPAIPGRFFQVPLLVKLRIFFVLNVHYIISGALSLLGTLLFLSSSRHKKSEDKTKRVYTYLLVFIGIIVAYLFFMTGFGLAPLEYQRFMSYILPFCTLFIGLSLMLFDNFLSKIFQRIEIRKLAFAFLLFVLLSLSLIQFFLCQPLIPRASVLGKNLPENEYLVDIHYTNTIYQKEMISFVENRSSQAKIVSDIATEWQVYGFSSGLLILRHMKYSPLEPDRNQRTDWDLFLLHTSKAGPFEEKVEYRTEQRIENIRTEAGDLIYDNGESFVISHVDMPAKIP